MYRSVYKNSSDEFTERKSKFIGHAFFVTSEEEAQERISEIKEKYNDATHNCSAYIIGEDKLIQRFHDNGEPSGTAGIPILEVLKKENLTNVCVVVTRYFGGIMLGAGGLIRAYTKGCKIALDASVIVEMTEFDKISVSFAYESYGAIENYLRNEGYKILDTSYTDKVSVQVYKDLNSDILIKDLNNLTSGNIEIEKLERVILPCKDNKILY